MSSSPLRLASTPETVLFGRLPCAATEPVGEVADGGVLVVETVSHEGILPDQGSDPVAFFGALGIAPDLVMDDAREIAAAGLRRDPAHDGPHVVTGPVHVAGARPGDLLRVEVLALSRRARYGIVSNRHAKGVLAGQYPAPAPDGSVPDVVSVLATVDEHGRGSIADSSGRAIGFDLVEFLGLMGVATPGGVELPSTPPGPYGGNLDITHLGVGSSLLLPVAVEGALFYTGDPHYAQGNGEVALTAFEAPLEATLRLSVERDSPARRIADALGAPFGETEDEWITVGLAPGLDEALAAATRAALELVVTLTGLERHVALAYLSAAADFEVSQAVNGVRGVHCRIDRRDLERASATMTGDARRGGTTWVS